MQEALYPVPQGGGTPSPPSRLLIVKADPSPINPVPQTLQGKSQDPLTVRLPLLIPFVFPPVSNAYPPVILQGKNQDPLTVRPPVLFKVPLPAGTALTSNVILSGRPTDLSILTVRSPFLVPLLPPVPPLVSTVIIRGSTQDLLTGLILPVRSPLLSQPPLPGGFFNTKLVLTGRTPADLPATSVRGPSLVPLVTPIATSGVFDFWHYYSP